VLPTALILDFGEVLVRPQSRTSVETLAALAGLPVEDSPPVTGATGKRTISG
jgi:hypothetical protein